MVFSRLVRPTLAPVLALCLVLALAWPCIAEQSRLPLSVSDTLSAAEIDARLAAIDADSSFGDAPAQLLLSLFSRAGSDKPPDEAAIIKRHVARVIPLLPDSLKDLVAQARHRTNLDQWELQADVAQVLRSWWRSQDPMPASDKNQRLDEHIRRVSHALAEYPADTPTGYDDRGMIFVRLGEPYQRREISYSDGRMIRDVFRFGVPVNLSDFPENEIWTYPHVHRNIFYIFVSENRGPYRIGTSEDLLPRRLRVVTTGSPRSMNISASSLAAMRYILERLAMIHSDFGSQYAQVDNYAMWQEERRMSRRAGAPLLQGEHEQVVGVGSTSMAVYSNPLLSINPINEFVRASLTETRILDRQSRRARDEVVPEVYSTILVERDVDRIPIAIRSTRFRQPDGSTSVFVDWAPMPGALNKDDHRLSSLEASGHDLYREAVLSLTVLEEDSRFVPLSIERDTFALLSGNVDGKVITPQTAQLVLSGPGNRLAVQVDHYAAAIREGPPLSVLIGPLIQVGLERSEPMQPLQSDPGMLEMSDLRPGFTLYTASALAATDDPTATTQPFPFSFVPSQGSLILEFEVYNLTFDQDDLTHYHIEYEVARRDPDRGLRGVLGQTRLERTSARTRHEGSGRTAREYIVLDSAPWSRESEVVLTVRVTDAVAGSTSERSLVFQN